MSWNDILNSPQWAAAVERVRDNLTQVVMNPATKKKERKDALLKHQMVDEFIGQLSAELLNTQE